MKMLAALAIIAALGACAGAEVEDEKALLDEMQHGQEYVITVRSMLHEEPAVDSPVTGVLPENALVVLMETTEEGDWAKVGVLDFYNRLTSGWLPEGRLRPAED
jgi:hypothetical protein